MLSPLPYIQRSAYLRFGALELNSLHLADASIAKTEEAANWLQSGFEMSWIHSGWSFLPEGRLGHITNHKRFQILTLCNSPSFNSIATDITTHDPLLLLEGECQGPYPRCHMVHSSRSRCPAPSTVWHGRDACRFYLSGLIATGRSCWVTGLAWWLIDRPSWQWSERDKVFRGVVRERRQITEWSDQVWKKLKKCLGNF